MFDNNGGFTFDTTENEEPTDVNSESSTEETETKAERPIENYMAEMSRKMKASESKIEQKFEQLANLIQTVAQSAGKAPAATQATNEVETSRPVTAGELLQRDQLVTLETTYNTFPQLDQKSDEYDPEFFKKVNEEFMMNFQRDPKGPYKAAKLIAAEMGLFQQLERDRVLADESRRTRYLSQGTTQSKQAAAKKQSGLNDSVKSLAALLGQNPNDVEKFAKNNGSKYGLKD